MTASCELFKNTKRSEYARHAATPIDKRLTVVENMIPVFYGYFTERQPTGYVPKGYGLPARKPFMSTMNERRRLELLADYILAEDLADGLLLTDRFREETDENCLEFPPLGAGARAYQDAELNFLTAADMEHRKVCESCRSYFIDRSPAKNAKRCSIRCFKWSEMNRIRAFRSGGDGRRQRDIKRQQLEYPFYSPYELDHLAKYSERCYTDDAIDRKVLAKKRGRNRKKPQGITMDSALVSTHHTPYNPSEEGVSGPVVVRNKRPEVIARYLRMKYGIGRIPRTSKHYSEAENTSSSVDIFLAAV